MKLKRWILCFLIVSLSGCQIKTGFVETDEGLLYRDDSGKQLYGLQEIKGDTYYFDEEGLMQTGMQKVEDEYYYFADSGKMQTGLQNIKEDTYLFDDSGVMVTGYQQMEDKNYYFDDDGKMVKDQKFPYENNTIVAFDEAGVMEVLPDVAFLQAGVQSIVSKYAGSVSVYFKDLTSNESFSMNPRTYYPCCMIKVAALAAIMEEINDGKISYEDYKFYIDNMIIVSDNTSYNRMMKAIGGGDGAVGLQKVNFLANRLGLSSTVARHGLLPGKDYFKSGEGGNVSSAQDLGILFEKIYRKELVGSDKMLELLLQCNDDDELMQGLPKDTPFANKTGCAYELYHDGGIVFGPEKDYILVVFQDGVRDHHSMMREISSFIYTYMNES